MLPRGDDRGGGPPGRPRRTGPRDHRRPAPARVTTCCVRQAVRTGRGAVRGGDRTTTQCRATPSDPTRHPPRTPRLVIARADVAVLDLADLLALDVAVGV